MRWRGTRLGLLVPVVVLAGCGYVGEPLPPALRLPVRVNDLAAVQRGTHIIIQFTLPKVTTEDLPVEGEADLELRIGAPATFDPRAFAEQSDRVMNITRGQPRAVAEVPLAAYAGKRVVIGVRVNGPHGRNAGWSNLVALEVLPALPTPEALAAANGPDSARLSWRAPGGPGVEFRAFRKLPADVNWTFLGTATEPSYTDPTIEYGKTYQYFVQTVRKSGDTYAESEISSAITFTPADQFPPAVPAGLTAIPAIRSNELVWQRNSERDVASYTVYRNGAKLAGGLTAPAYSDGAAQPGVTYQYQVTATDTAGNESGKSAAVPATIP